MAIEVNEPTTPEEHIERLARALKTLAELDTTRCELLAHNWLRLSGADPRYWAPNLGEEAPR